MQRDTLVGQEASEWCAGLPLDGVRALSDFELTALRSEARRMRCWGALAFLPLPLVIAALWGSATLLPRSISTADAVTLFLALALAATLVLSPLLACRYLGRGGACARDARAGCLKRFEGCIGVGTTIDGALTQNRLLRADANARQWLELLPSSGRLWSANGHMTPFWITLRTTTVANTPANAYAAAREVNVAAEAAGGAKLIGERDLSAKEREELGGHIWRAWRTNALTAVLSTAWASFYCYFGFVRHAWPDSAMNALAGTWFFALAIIADSAFITGVMRACRLKRDRKRGRALMISLPVDAKGESGAETSTREIETLPYSRSLWTSSGAPAGWRKTRI